MSDVPQLSLSGGGEIPQLGFGVFQVPPEDTEAVVSEALEVGYRHIDTAAAYQNEKGVGAAIASSGLAREEVFVTTKLWNEQQGSESAPVAFEKSLGRLGLDYVDLYLIHWPVPERGLSVETWREFERFQEDGRARAIGVSNFRIEDLERLDRETEVTPAVNQIELHPNLQQAELRSFHADHGILTEAWSPLAQGAALDDPAIASIAERHGKTAAQVVLRWHIQLGNVVIPKSVTSSRIGENFDLFGFELDGDEMASLERLERGERIGPDPATFVAP